MFYRQMIQEAAAEYTLDWRLVEAIVRVESSGNADAFRFEPKFWSRYLAKLPEYKRVNPRRVSSSYGLMQPMFRTAFEHGFAGEPEELFQPTVNLQVGCKILQDLIQWASGYPSATPERQLEAAIASYNGGRGSNAPTETLLRNGQYVKKVIAAYQRIVDAEHT